MGWAHQGSPADRLLAITPPGPSWQPWASDAPSPGLSPPRNQQQTDRRGPPNRDVLPGPDGLRHGLPSPVDLMSAPGAGAFLSSVSLLPSPGLGWHSSRLLGESIGVLPLPAPPGRVFAWPGREEARALATRSGGLAQGGLAMK